jgi:hypothetical protein
MNPGHLVGYVRWRMNERFLGHEIDARSSRIFGPRKRASPLGFAWCPWFESHTHHA